MLWAILDPYGSGHRHLPGTASLIFRESSEVFDQAYSLGRQLGRLRSILVGLETYPYASGSALSALAAPFTQEGQRPSAALRRVGLIISAAGLRNNPFLALLLNLVVPWDVFFAYQLERLKKSLRIQLPIWLETWHEMEALVSIANFASLHPQLTFPEIKSIDARPILDCCEIGHPLIPMKDQDRQ